MSTPENCSFFLLPSRIDKAREFARAGLCFRDSA